MTILMTFDFNKRGQNPAESFRYGNRLVVGVEIKRLWFTRLNWNQDHMFFFSLTYFQVVCLLFFLEFLPLGKLSHVKTTFSSMF